MTTLIQLHTDGGPQGEESTPWKRLTKAQVAALCGHYGPGDYPSWCLSPAQISQAAALLGVDHTRIVGFSLHRE